MTSGPRVAVLILNWNGWEDTRECLRSLQQSSATPSVYVVDNGSTDGSPDRVSKEFPWAKLVPLPENRGFPGGMNAGIWKSIEDGHDFVICLNNDMVFEPDFLGPLLTAQTEGVIPYPSIYSYDQRDTIDNLGQRLDLFTGLTRMVAHGHHSPPSIVDADYTEVPVLSREALEKVGGWDESYFAFYEDADLCLRLREAGWRIKCVPESRVYHKRGRTAARVRGLVSYYSIRNRLKVVRAHASLWHYVTTLLHILLWTIPYIGLRCLLKPGYKHSFRHTLLGLLDGAIPWRRKIQRTWTMRMPSQGVSKP